MPTPKDGESEKDFVERCIPMVMHDGSASGSDQAVAMCHTMFKDHHDKMGSGGDMGKALDTLVAYGGELKMLDNGHLGGYLVRFSTANDPDLTGDFFTKNTDFGIEPGKTITSPVYFHHRMPLPTRDGAYIQVKKKIGTATLSLDDIGVLIDAILFNREQYEKEIAKSAKSLDWSSGTAAHLVDREPVGTAFEIKTWLLGLDASVTPTPAEPRNHVVSLKSLTTTPAPAENESGQNPAVSPAAASVTQPATSNVKGLTDMNEQELAAFMDAREARAKAEAETKAKIEADRQEAIKAAVATERKVWEAEMKNSGRRGGYATGVEDETPVFDYKAVMNAPFTKARQAYWRSTTVTRDVAKAMKGYIRFQLGDGELQDALKAEAKASNNTDMNIATPGDGGYAVPTGHYQGIIAKCDESALYGPLGVMDIPGKGTTVNVPYDDGTANVFVSTAETVAFDADAPALNQAQMTLVKYTKDITLSDELMEDEDSKLMAFLDNYVGRALARTYNSLLLTALAAGATAYTLGSASTLAAADVTGMVFGIKDCYADGAKWLTKRSTEGIIRGLTGTYWQFAPTPAATGFSNSTLWGYPVFHSEFATAPAASAKSIYFGDFSYVGMRGGGLSFLRDPYSKASNGQLLLHYYTRTVFKVLIAEAILRGTHPSA